MPERRRMVVRAKKMPKAQRDVAHAAFADPESAYADIRHSNDTSNVPFGARVAYVAYLTPEEIERFRGASNCLTVEPDEEHTADLVEVEPLPDGPAAAVGIPEPAVLTWLGADPNQLGGVGVKVAVLDGGVSRSVREKMGNWFIATRNFSGTHVGDDGITTDHGCMVAPLCVPPSAEVFDAIIANDAGSSRTSAFAAAVYAAIDDHQVRVINYSYSGGSTSSVARDAVGYAQDHGVLVFCSAGNDGQYVLGSPSDLCRTYWGMISSVAFDHRTSKRASFSNHHEDASGAAPGRQVMTFNQRGEPILVSGTSFSSPLMAYVATVLLSSGYFTAQQVSNALKVTARDTARPTRDGGRGGWHLTLALSELRKDTAPPPTPAPVPPSPSPTPTVPIPPPAPAPPREPEWLQRLRTWLAMIAVGSNTPLWLSQLIRKVLGR